MITLNFISTSKATISKFTSSSLLLNDESAFEKIATGIKDLNENFSNSVNNLNSIFDFFNQVGNFFEETLFWITHPSQLLGAFQPWIIIALLVMIMLKVLGFNTDKWFRLSFLIFILSLVF